MSCTTIPNRAYALNIGTMPYNSADGRTNVNVPIVRSGDSEHSSAADATTMRTGTYLSDGTGQLPTGPAARSAEGPAAASLAGAFVEAGHRKRAMSARTTSPQPRLSCCSSKPSRTPAAFQTRFAIEPSSGCSTGGTR
jgi:hypothetical protein